jgi:hypothetical protein
MLGKEIYKASFKQSRLHDIATLNLVFTSYIQAITFTPSRSFLLVFSVLLRL